MAQNDSGVATVAHLVEREGASGGVCTHELSDRAVAQLARNYVVLLADRRSSHV